MEKMQTNLSGVGAQPEINLGSNQSPFLHKSLPLFGRDFFVYKTERLFGIIPNQWQGKEAVEHSLQIGALHMLCHSCDNDYRLKLIRWGDRICYLRPII